MRRSPYIFAATGVFGAMLCALGWAAPEVPQARQVPQAPRAPAGPQAPQRAGASAGPTFYRDVLPILQAHCQECHRADGIAPMALGSYDQTRIFADAIRVATANKTMPPWLAEA